MIWVYKNTIIKFYYVVENIFIMWWKVTTSFKVMKIENKIEKSTINIVLICENDNYYELERATRKKDIVINI